MTTASGPFGELAEAYEGLEGPHSFPDRASLDRYRDAVLQRSEPQAEFLMRHLPPSARVVEVGCGNGRLLLELARRNAIARSLGVDLAASRVAFAARWAEEEGFDALEFVAADMREYRLPSETFAAAVAITGAFAYFEPIEPGAGSALLRKLHRTLASGGLLCLELYPHPAYRRLLEVTGGRARIWTELPADDPWRFYLSELSLDASADILTHEKTFIHRSTGEIDSGRRERLYLYTEQTVSEPLVAARFREVQFFDGWSGEPYSGGEVMVVTARK